MQRWKIRDGCIDRIVGGDRACQIAATLCITGSSLLLHAVVNFSSKAYIAIVKASHCSL